MEESIKLHIQAVKVGLFDLDSTRVESSETIINTGRTVSESRGQTCNRAGQLECLLNKPSALPHQIIQMKKYGNLSSDLKQI